MTPAAETEYGLRIRQVGEESGGSALMSLGTNVTESAQSAACSNVDLVAVGTEHWFTESLAVDRFEGSCNGGGGQPEHVARIRIEQAGNYRITNLRDDRAGVLYLRRGCEESGSEVLCVNGSVSDIIALEPGDYFLFVGYALPGPQGIHVEAMNP